MYDKTLMPVFFLLLRGLVSLLWLFIWIPPLFSMGEVFQWTDSRGIIHLQTTTRLFPSL